MTHEPILLFIAHELRIKRPGSAGRKGEPLPVLRAHQLTSDDVDLPDVEAVMIELAGDRGVDRVGHAADHHDLPHILNRQRPERLEQYTPPVLPTLHDPSASFGRVRIGGVELRVAIAIGLLAIGREEVRETRDQVPRDVIGDDRTRVKPGREDSEELFVAELVERVLAEGLLAFEDADPDGDEVVGEGGVIILGRLKSGRGRWGGDCWG